MLPEDERHGAERGYEQHVRDGEDPCADCYQAKLLAARRRRKRQQMGHRYTVPSTKARARLDRWRAGGASYGDIADHTGLEEGRCWEILNDGAPTIYTRTALRIMAATGWPVTTLGITRRVRALVRIGWTVPHIAEACGVHHDTILDIRRRRPEFVSRRVRDAIVAGYETLSMRLPQPQSKQDRAGVTRARNHATRSGWFPPLAWNDIDDPDERPSRAKQRPNGRDLDPVVVERFLGGDHALPTTYTEKREIARRWVAMGRTQYELEHAVGWNSARLLRTDGAVA